MFASFLRLYLNQRSSSNRHKARSPLHRIDRDAVAATPARGRRYATQYHTIYLPNPASFFWKYCFASETGRRRARPNARARPPVCRRPVRRASPGSNLHKSPRVLPRRRAGAGRRGLLVFAPSALFWAVPRPGLRWCFELPCRLSDLFLGLATSSGAQNEL